jgi:hypothetical protein
MQAVKTPVRRWAAGVRTGADYVQGVWVRLNGGGRRADGVIAGLPAGLQMPTASKEARAAATKALSLEISSLEKRLQESSKVGGGRTDESFSQGVCSPLTRTIRWLSFELDNLDMSSGTILKASSSNRTLLDAP